MPLLVNRRALISGGSVPRWILPGFAGGVDAYFSKGLYYGMNAPPGGLTTSRASAGTSLLPTSASGAAYLIFGNNVPRIVPGLGLLVEEARTNVLLHSTAPVTQTTASLGTGTYSLWVNGSGSATSSAGTATITGGGAATQGLPNTFVVTVAGTVVITVAGSLNAFQCESIPSAVGAPTSLIVTTGAPATRAADAVTLTQPPTFGSAYTLYAAGTPNMPVGFIFSQKLLSAYSAANNFSALYRANGGSSIFVAQIDAVGSTVFPQLNSSWLAATLAKVAVTSTGSVQTFAVNGVNGAGASGATPIGLTTVSIGSALSITEWFNGYISRIAIAPTTARPAATLPAITALNAFN